MGSFVARQEFGGTSLTKMVRENPGGKVDGCPRKLGSMVSKWVISPTYKWGILGL